ncbi:hypothetical protein ACP275_11G060800 [Erythranthe tilingii]
MGDVSNRQLKRKSEEKSPKSMKKKWTPKEDAVLIASLSELCNAGWKRKNGIFKSGYTSALETKLKSRLPNCNIKASPHIESRLKLLKRQYDAITEMQGAHGIQWNDKDNVLICEDDDVWDEWIQIHTDAKGLRNKQFPYYNDLHILFGNRGTRKGVYNETDSDKILDDEVTIAATNFMVVNDTFEEDEEEREYSESYRNRSFATELDLTPNIEHYKKRKSQRDVNVIPNHSEDSAEETNKSDDERQPRTSNVGDSNKKSCNSECELAKVFGSFLDKYQEHVSLLSEIIGREKTAEKIVCEKRTRLNGELTKLPNLSLQARLRAATLIVSDSAKLDLFYSLSKEERREWVSMLLTGLV